MPSPASISMSWTSLSRTTSPSIRYSLSPDRYRRRDSSTSRTMAGSSSRMDCVCGASGCPSMTISPAAAATAASPGVSSAGFGAARPCPGTRDATPLRRRRTSAADVGFRPSLPWKMMSCMCSPRRLFALCSPSTHVMASTTLLLPQPLGPTMAVTPVSKASSDRSAKLLKPEISRRFRRIAG